MKLLYLDEVESTNTYVKIHMSELEDRTIVYTSHQTNGKGRLSRRWIDTGSDNIYMTFFLKPFDEFQELYSNITQYLSVVLCNVLDDYGIKGEIKWPNDVLVNGRKIAGILSETSMQGDKFLGLALGVGVNLNTTSEQLAEIDKPATSLSVEYGKHIDRDKFLKQLSDKFFLDYDDFLDTGFPLIKDEYVSKTSFLGSDIKINVLGKIHSGVAVDITDSGAIILDNDGEKTIFTIGDIL